MSSCASNRHDHPPPPPPRERVVKFPKIEDMINTG